MVILKVVVFEIEECHKNECELGVEVRNAGVKVIAGGCGWIIPRPHQG